MGICYSSSWTWKDESEENIVYVGGKQASDCVNGGGIRRLSSLYSRQGRKGPNQDSAILCQGYGAEDGVFCGVFDGHGKNGHIVSRVVRDYLPSLLLSHRNVIANFALAGHRDVEKCSKEGENYRIGSLELVEEWKEASINAFKAMDGELKLLTHMDCSYSGTTAVTIIKQGEDVIVANLGDSRAVLGTLTKEGRLKAVQLTIDLKPSVPQEAERIRSSNGRVFAMEDEPNIQRIWMPDGNSSGLSMARAFGDFQLKNYGLIAVPEISHHRLNPPADLFIVLATDGVWDVLTNEEVVTMVASAEEMSSGEAAKMVVEAATKAWRRKFPSSAVDDCSAVCFFLQ
ncbi:probable protein phosphatase 2C 12 [Phalaenopsis equestris]|uniref:probable protein phosphatase 2C 12 n=1 Tax=Phalaenopsis equestris TaxID=78828 RepID=UPI0009E5017B|nr:probable protein phosphatase 2C 12 [Phalaenopsis equestris]